MEIDALLAAPAGSVSVEQMLRMADAFYQDAQGDQLLAARFHEARERIMRVLGKNAPLEQLHNSAQLYIAELSDAEEANVPVITAMLVDEAAYYAVVNCQAACIQYVNMVIDREKISDEQYFRMHGLAIDVLIKLGMTDRMELYVTRLDRFLQAGTTLDTGTLYMACANLLYAYGFLRNEQRFAFYREKIRQLRLPEGMEWLVFFCDIYALCGLAVMDNREYDDLFRSEYERLFLRDHGDMLDHYNFFLIDQGFLVIPILQKAWRMKLANASTVLAQINSMIQTSTSVSEMCDYYSWFFEDMGVDPVDFPEEYHTYIRLLQRYRRLIYADERHQVSDQLLRFVYDRTYRKQATMDALTRLPNRYLYQQAVKKLEEGDLPGDLIVMMIDLNNLKYTNDEDGHQAGDQLLCSAADSLKDAIGDAGKVYRVGGDEFIALLNTDAEGLLRVRTRLDMQVALHKPISPKLSLSIGCAGAAEHPGEPYVTLLTIAEQGMYEAKRRFYASSGYDRRKR